MSSPGCVFCEIAAGSRAAHAVAETAETVAFLDHRPLFPGHVLVVPRAHVVTIPDLPDELVAPYYLEVRRVTRAVMQAMDAPGSLVVANNVVSQSVPHLHTHVVPRRRRDGLRGFFWPRHLYASEEEASDVAVRIRAAL